MALRGAEKRENDLLVHRWMAMKGYLGVLAKRGVLSFMFQAILVYGVP